MPQSSWAHASCLNPQTSGLSADIRVVSMMTKEMLLCKHVSHQGLRVCTKRACSACLTTMACKIDKWKIGSLGAQQHLKLARRATGVGVRREGGAGQSFDGSARALERLGVNALCSLRRGVLQRRYLLCTRYPANKLCSSLSLWPAVRARQACCIIVNVGFAACQMHGSEQGRLTGITHIQLIFTA